jgi:prevent-host-death family protein
MMSQFNIHTAKAHLSELIQKALLGEEVIIARDNKPMVKLVAIQPLKRQRKLEFAKGLISIQHDFDEPLDDFENYR